MKHRTTVTAVIGIAFAMVLFAVGERPARSGTSEGPPLKGKVYVSNADSGTVSVVDLTTLTETTTIDVGSNPRGCDLNAAGTFLYVPNRDSDSVSVISTSSDIVVGTVTLTGSEPYNLAITPDGSRVYVACKRSSTVAVIDTATMAEIANIPLSSAGSSPEGIAITPDGSEVYVANRQADTVDVIDTATNTISVSAIPVGRAPRDAKATDDGSKVIVVGEGGPDLIRTADHTVFTFPPTNDQRDVDVVGSTAYVTALFADRIDIYDLAGETFVRSIDLPNSSTPYALAVSKDESCVLVADVDDDSMRVVDVAAGIESEGPVAVGFGPRGIALLEDVNVAPPNTIRAFLLPKKVTLNLPAAKKKSPGIAIKSFFDRGPGIVDLTAPSTLTVGTRVIPIAGLVPDKKGKKFTFEDEASGTSVLVKPASIGSSKGTIDIKIAGDLSTEIDPDGDLPIRYQGSGFDAAGTVTLEGGKFTFGKEGGTLRAPVLDIRKAKATFPGIGRHGFKFVAGITTDGTVPAQAPDISIAFGQIFSATIPGSELQAKGSKFTFKGNIDGITTVVLDYAKERIAVKGKSIDLGEVAEGPNTLLLIVSIGDDTRAVEVLAIRKRKALKY